MGEIVTIVLIVSVTLCAGFYRSAGRQRQDVERNTREWIAFLNDDLAASRT